MHANTAYGKPQRTARNAGGSKKTSLIPSRSLDSRDICSFRVARFEKGVISTFSGGPV